MRRADDVLFVRGRRHTEWRKMRLPLRHDHREVSFSPAMPRLLDPERLSTCMMPPETVYELRQFAINLPDSPELFPVYVLRGAPVDDERIAYEIFCRRRTQRVNRYHGGRIIEGWHLFLAVLSRMREVSCA